MQISLDYGKQGLMVTLPDHLDVRTLAYKTATPLAQQPNMTDRQALQAVLDKPNNTPPLSEIIQGRSSVCIVICDITRPVPNQLMLEPILETLHAGGIETQNIKILIATGLHRPSRPEEIVEMVGAEIAEKYNVINHDAQDPQQLVYLGKSPRGVSMWINTHYMEADMKITVGLIEPHFMAGFSGGRKLVCPGIAGIETIRAWHSPRFLEHPNAATGQLDGNPVHSENTWIANRAGCNFIANVVIDAYRRPLKFVAGDQISAFEEGAAFCQDIVIDRVDQEYDIVITSSAGYPLDTTFYQSVKGMMAAVPIVKQGGSIILAASMTEGIGSDEFASLFKRHPNIDDFMQAIMSPDYFVMDQWQLEMMAKVLRKAEVKVVTDGLSQETIKQLFVDSAESVETAVDEALRVHGQNASIAVIPRGPYVIPEVVS